jgi:hypothetical protein
VQNFLFCLFPFGKLLDHGVDVENHLFRGPTALLIAAKDNIVDLVCFLLNHGANIIHQTANGMSMEDNHRKTFRLGSLVT